MRLSRRRLLSLAALGAAGLSLPARAAPDDPRLVLVVLRGALDGSRPYLRIGSELPADLSGVSIVAAGYGPPRGNLGAVSLIGPVRMDYALAIATVREASRALSSYVEDVYG